jgi:hypothetical protein
MPKDSFASHTLCCFVFVFSVPRHHCFKEGCRSLQGRIENSGNESKRRGTTAKNRNRHSSRNKVMIEILYLQFIFNIAVLKQNEC